MKVLSVVGARPQFIKEAIVGNEIRKSGVKEVLVNTGQHYDINMSTIFIENLNIKQPDYNLEVGSGTHAYQTGTTMIKLEKIVIEEIPDLIIVYGDTNATLAGALVGSKLKIPIAHIEAGMRQKPKDMPEEINRVVTDHVSNLLFCSTEKAKLNLEAEGIRNGVYFVGDVMYDLFIKIKESLDHYKVLKDYDLEYSNYILVTIHRDFNTDNKQKFENILKALDKLNEEIELVFPMHPRTKKALQSLEKNYLKKVKIIDPVSYEDMMALLSNSKKLITDSGGLQKEAYFAGVPAVVVMPDTCWAELIEAKWNVLAEAEEKDIYEKAINHSKPVKSKPNIYGDGKAGQKIAEIIMKNNYSNCY